MTNLIERLRWSGQDAMTKHYSLGMWQLHKEAADKIEEMRTLLREYVRLACSQAVEDQDWAAIVENTEKVIKD